MAFSIVSRALLRTSREILERNLAAVGVLQQTVVSNNNNTAINTASCCNLVIINDMHLDATYFHRSLHTVASTPTATLQCCKSNYKALSLAARQYSKKPNATTLRRDDSDSDSDSDDEYEKRRRSDKLHAKTERGDSEFWRRKMRTLHRILDVNHDGVISFDDFNLLAKRFNDLGHLSPEVAAEFMQVLQQTWEEQFGDITQYNLVTAEQFLADLHHRLNDKKMAKRIGRFLPYLFKAVDYDHSGHLDLEQYKLFFRCLGLSEEDAAISFAVIDKNGDGQLSLKEFVHLGRQFFLTEDDTKISKMFWGPLIDH